MSRQVTYISAEYALRRLWKIGGFSPEQNGLRKQKEQRKDEHLIDNILLFVES